MLKLSASGYVVSAGGSGAAQPASIISDKSPSGRHVRRKGMQMRWIITFRQHARVSARSVARALAARLLVAAGVVLLASCALPDLKPFAESTARIHAAVLKTEVDLPALVRDAGKPDDAARLEAHLAVRTQALNGVLRYTESLAHIAAAGQSGASAAGKVGDSLNGLLGVLKAAPLSGEALSTVTLAYGYIAQVRAAGEFAKAVAQADPVVQTIAGILDKDFKALENLVPQVRPTVQRRVMERTPEIVALQDYRAQLERQRRQVEKQLGESPGQSALVAQARDIGMQIDQTRDRYEPLLAEQREIAVRARTLTLLMAKTRQAVAEWAVVHGSLASDVSAGMSPNVTVLLSLATQIQGLTEGGTTK